MCLLIRKRICFVCNHQIHIHVCYGQLHVCSPCPSCVSVFPVPTIPQFTHYGRQLPFYPSEGITLIFFVRSDSYHYVWYVYICHNFVSTLYIKFMYICNRYNSDLLNAKCMHCWLWRQWRSSMVDGSMAMMRRGVLSMCVQLVEHFPVCVDGCEWWQVSSIIEPLPSRKTGMTKLVMLLIVTYVITWSVGCYRCNSDLLNAKCMCCLTCQVAICRWPATQAPNCPFYAMGSFS